MVALFITFLLYLRAEPHLLNLTKGTIAKPQNWKIALQTVDPKLLTDNHRTTIDKQVRKHLLTGSRDELQNLAQSILRNTVFDKVSIKRTRTDKLKIDLTIPSPLAIIKADKYRFLSTNGSIFGSASEHDLEKFITIEGIFKSQEHKVKFNETNKIIVTEAQQESIDGIVTFLKDANESNITIKTLIHNDFRGLALKLKGTYTYP